MRWPPYQHVFFDCDSTLTTVEGIDALAGSAGKGWRVEVLTRAAMDGELDLEEVYAKRLRAVRPTRKQVRDIHRTYKQNIVEDASELIAALQALGHQIYIISGGLAEPVTEFGVYLGVPRDNIRAVDLRYDALSGHWWVNREEQPNTEARYLHYEEGALTVSDGKAKIIRELRGAQTGRALLVGDGSSDLLAAEAVDLFVGFGGVTRRSSVEAAAPVYLHSSSLAPLVAVVAGPAALPRLQRGPYALLAERAQKLIETGAITFQDERLNSKFQQAYQAVHTRSY